MKNILRLATIILLMSAPLQAALIEVSLGDQDFMDGDEVLAIPFGTASVGEPIPFDMYRGSDANTNFMESWTFAYGAIVDPLEVIVSASIQIGIADHDAAHAGSQLASFTGETGDLTSDLDTLFEASGGANNEYNVFTISLPSGPDGMFSDLRDGSALFSLALQGPTPAFMPPVPIPGFPPLPDLTHNGAGLDFAKLTIETFVDEEPPTPGVPEPSTALLLLGGGLGWFASRRRIS